MAEIIKPDGTPARGIATAKAEIGGMDLEYTTDPTLIIGFNAHIGMDVVAERLTVYGVYVNALSREVVALRKELSELKTKVDDYQASADTTVEPAIKL